MGHSGSTATTLIFEAGTDRLGAAPSNPQPNTPKDRDFVRVGRSRIEGTGLFAKRRIHRGARIIEYAGERVESARLMFPIDGAQGPQIYTFRLNETTVIDGARGGNVSRFINHSCAPNCEAYSFDDRMYIYAQVDIVRGQELTFDYKLAPSPGRRAKAGEDEHVCRCGAPNCRGTMRRPTRKRRTIAKHQGAKP